MGRTLDEILAGYAQMSSTLGLTPNTQGSQGYGPASQTMAVPAPFLPPPPPPMVAHPGTVSQQIASTGMFSPQFNYGAATAGQLSSQMAMMMGGLGPSAPQMQYMSPQQYGVFRTPFPMGRPSGYEAVPPVSLPMQPMPSVAMFTPPGEFSANHALLSQRRDMAMMGASTMAQNQLMLGGGAAFLGGGVGSVFGGMLGGRAGAAIGGTMGSVLGGMSIFTPPMQYLSASMSSRALHHQATALAVQEASGFMTGMGATSPTGQGLSMASSMSVASGLAGAANSSGGIFNRKDMLNLMRASSDQGILDFSRSSDDIVKAVKNVSVVVSTLAKITGDPDFRNHVKLIGDLQRMGLTTLQSGGALYNAHAFARLAGSDVGSMMAREGMAGAATFQGAGLLGGVGAISAITNAGLARSMMQSGAISPALAALNGGESGITQGFTNAQAAFLSGPGKILLASLLKKGAHGLELGSTSGIFGSDFDINKMMQKASTNLGDTASLQDFSARSPELMAQLTTQLQSQNPMGIQLAMAKMIQSMQKTMGPGITFTTAAQNMGMDPAMARALQQSFSKDNIDNVRKQMTLNEQQNMVGQMKMLQDTPGAFRLGLHRFMDGVDAALPHFASGSYSEQESAEAAEDARYAALGRQRIRAKGTSSEDMAFFGRTKLPSSVYKGMLSQGYVRDGSFAGLKNNFQDFMDANMLGGEGDALVDAVGGGGNFYDTALDALTFGIGGKARRIGYAAFGPYQQRLARARQELPLAANALNSATGDITSGASARLGQRFGSAQMGKIFDAGASVINDYGSAHLFSNPDSTAFNDRMKSAVRSALGPGASETDVNDAVSASLDYNKAFNSEKYSVASRLINDKAGGLSHPGDERDAEMQALTTQNYMEKVFDEFTGTHEIIGSSYDEKAKVTTKLLRICIQKAGAQNAQQLSSLVLVVLRGGTSGAFIAKYANGSPAQQKLLKLAQDMGNENGLQGAGFTPDEVKMLKRIALSSAAPGETADQTISRFNKMTKGVFAGAAAQGKKQLISAAAQSLGVKVSGESTQEQAQSLARGIQGSNASAALKSAAAAYQAKGFGEASYGAFTDALAAAGYDADGTIGTEEMDRTGVQQSAGFKGMMQDITDVAARIGSLGGSITDAADHLDRSARALDAVLSGAAKAGLIAYSPANFGAEEVK